MNILVTGGLGFVGSTLIMQLENKYPNASIVIVDNKQSSAVDEGFFLDRNGRFDGVEFHNMTVSDFLARYKGDRFDQIYHLASVVGPVGVLKYAGTIAKSILDDTALIIDKSREWSAKFVDVSTSEVYGGGNNGYCVEDMPKIITHKTSARLEYAIGKLAAETMIINSGANGVIIRPFNIVGQRQKTNGGFVLPRFMEAALKGEPLTVYYDGSAVRAFTDVRDICRGLIAAMERGKAGEAYNLGNPDNKVTILELAKRVIQITGSKSEIKFVDPKKLWGDKFEEAADKYPNSQKANTELGWRATIGLDQIIKESL